MVRYLIGNVMKMPSTFGLSLSEADQTLSEIIFSLLSSLTVSSNIQSTKMWIRFVVYSVVYLKEINIAFTMVIHISFGDAILIETFMHSILCRFLLTFCQTKLLFGS
jgi:hypothetical protein